MPWQNPWCTWEPWEVSLHATQLAQQGQSQHTVYNFVRATVIQCKREILSRPQSPLVTMLLCSEWGINTPHVT